MALLHLKPLMKCQFIISCAIIIVCLRCQSALHYNRTLVGVEPPLSWRERNKANPYIYNRKWKPKGNDPGNEHTVDEGIDHDITIKRSDMSDQERDIVVTGNGLTNNGYISSCFDKTCTTPWLDDSNERIEAHGGGILNIDGMYYWYGEAGKKISEYGYGYSLGFNCYSSKHLYGPWKFEKMIFSQDDLAVQELVSSTKPYIMERPKIIYNAKHDTYVLWFHLDAADILDDSTMTEWQRQKKIKFKYGYRRAAVALSHSSILGPYDFVHAILPNNEKCLDLQLYQERNGEEEEAYLIRSVNNKFVGITRLSADYLSVIGNVVTMVKPALEAMTLFRHPVTHCLYAIMSHLTGWEPNPLVLLQAFRKGSEIACHRDCNLIDPLEWRHLGNPTRDRASYNAQPTFTVTTSDGTGNPYVMIMCDNWLRAGPRGLQDAGYIWLPLNLHHEAAYDMVMKKFANWSMLAPF